jgi:hypothetical protein
LEEDEDYQCATNQDSSDSDQSIGNDDGISGHLESLQMHDNTEPDISFGRDYSIQVDLGEVNAMDISGTGPGPTQPNSNVNLHTARNALRPLPGGTFMEEFDSAAKKYGQSAPRSVDTRPFPNETFIRNEYPFYPFASEMEWEFAAVLHSMDVSTLKLDRLLATEYVECIHCFAIVNCDI